MLASVINFEYTHTIRINSGHEGIKLANDGEMGLSVQTTTPCDNPALILCISSCFVDFCYIHLSETAGLDKSSAVVYRYKVNSTLDLAWIITVIRSEYIILERVSLLHI